MTAVTNGSKQQTRFCTYHDRQWQQGHYKHNVEVEKTVDKIIRPRFNTYKPYNHFSDNVLHLQYYKGKGKGAYSSSWNSPQNYRMPLVNGITQCYLPPDKSDRPAFTPTGQVGTQFIDPVRTKGWVGLGQNISQRGVWSRISPRGASGQNLNVATESRKFLTVFHSYYWSNLLSFQDTTTGQ